MVENGSHAADRVFMTRFAGAMSAVQDALDRLGQFIDQVLAGMGGRKPQPQPIPVRVKPPRQR